MRKPLSSAKKRPIEDVRKTRSTTLETKKKVKPVKKVKSNESSGKAPPKDSNMTSKLKLNKKTQNTKIKPKLENGKAKVVPNVKKVTPVKKVDKNKKKPGPKKVSNQEKVVDNVNSDAPKEPVEVVIHVKKPQPKTAQKKAKKSNVSSGKIGKRKVPKQAEPAKTLIKNINNNSGKLESVVSAILEVAVLAKKIVVPKIKSTPPKVIVKKNNCPKKKPEIKKLEIKKESDKPSKDTKEVSKKDDKKPIKDIKKEIKTEKNETNLKEDKTKESKKQQIVKEDKKKKEIPKPKKKESKDVKKEPEPTPGCSKTIKGKKNIAIKKLKMSKTDDTKSDKKSDEESKASSSDKLVKKVQLPTKSKKAAPPPKKRAVTNPKGKKAVKPIEKPDVKPKSPINEVAKSEDSDEDMKTRRMKLFGFWEGPKRHREASLNAIAKVHCLYENESRSMMEIMDKPKRTNRKTNIKTEPESSDERKSDVSLPKEDSIVARRTLRTAPGMRSIGRHYEAETSSSSPPSSSEESDYERKVKKIITQKKPAPPPLPVIPAIKEKPAEVEKKKEEPPIRKVRKRRKRCELMMDLKDMVVRKRMASLNASAMLAATYSMEKRSVRGDDSGNRDSSDDSTSTDMEVESSDDEVIVSGSSKKVAVIVNQDTDVTITGLYVNSTTRSTRHCSITGMQYRISSTSHTQTESTAVTTETVIHTTDHVSVSHSQSGSSVEAVGSPGGSCKSYTPLGALSSMQPPGNTSPLMRRHPCSTSAFSAPPYHPHQEIHGYYQPAGPLISHHHHHTSASTSSALPTVSGVGSKGSPGLEPQSRPSEPTSEPPEYRTPPGFPGAYPPPQYTYQYIQPSPYHQDCYSTTYYHKYPNYRRYWSAPPGPPSTQMVTSDSYPQGGPLVDPFPPHPPPPPPPHHSGYGVYTYSAGPPPPPPCYSHSPASRGLAFIDPSFQCPCPMQSCPKNVHTGPLTGASKGSGQTVQAQNQGVQVNQQSNVVSLEQQQMNSQEAVPAPLPPVALALPLEPNGVNLGPPSPARGSAGMPPPASPALSSNARNPPSWSPTGHPVPIKEETLSPKRIPTPPPEQTFLDISENLVQRSRPMKRKSTEHEISIEPVMNDVLEQPASKKRKPTHELTSPRRLLKKCKEEPECNTISNKLINSENEPALIENIDVPVQVDQKVQVLDINTLLDVKPIVEKKPQLIEKLEDNHLPQEQIVHIEKPQPQPKKVERKPSIEKKVLTDKKNNTINSVEKKTKKKAGVKKETQPKTKNCKTECKKGKKTNIKIKKEIDDEFPLVRSHPTLKWSNGWSWEGEPYKAKVFLTSDEPVVRLCYPAMRHLGGDVICPRDCILLKSGPRKQQLPFVAKVTAMWENPDDGEMIVSLLWYYRPEHTEQGRLPGQPDDEIFASRHKDINSVACIEDKCYVLTFNEYCRYKTNMKMLEYGKSQGVRSVVPDMLGIYPRTDRIPKGPVSKDILFFCRRVYDFRQKRLLKNP